MRSRGKAIAIDLDDNRLVAVELSLGTKTTIRRFHHDKRGPAIRPDDTAAIGDWISRSLSDAGFSKAPVVLSLPRREAVFKQLNFPDTPDARAEIVQMVRLQMERHIASTLEGESAIDCGEQHTEGGKINLLGVAIPSQRLALLREIMRAAKLSLAGVTFRSLGAARVVDTDEPTLVVTLGERSAEMCHISGGTLLFSRAVELERSAGDGRSNEHYAERLAVEVKRTWMGLRVSLDGPAISRIVVLGAGDLADEVAVRCAHATQLDAQTMFVAPWLKADAVDPAHLADALPLAGLFRSGQPRLINLIKPLAPPDRNATTRQLVLGSVLALIVFAGGGYVLAQGALKNLENRLTIAQETNRELQDAYGSQLVARARLAHLRAAREVDASWLAHLRAVASSLEGDTKAILNDFTGSVESGVRFDPNGEGLLSGSWELQRQVAITLSGTGIEGPATAQIRQALLALGLYRVQTQGPDGNTGFKLRLGSAAATPKPDRISDQATAPNDEEPAS